MSPERRLLMATIGASRYYLAGMSRGARVANMALARTASPEARSGYVKMARYWNHQMLRDLRQ